MIDATKLVDLQEYWILFSDKSPRMARYYAAHGNFYAIEGLTHEPSEVTDAIPIPTPEELQANAKELAELREQVSRMAGLAMAQKICGANARSWLDARYPDRARVFHQVDDLINDFNDLQELVKEMREVISDVANSAIEHTNAGKYHVMQIDIETYNKARTLLEKTT